MSPSFCAVHIAGFVQKGRGAYASYQSACFDNDQQGGGKRRVFRRFGVSVFRAFFPPFALQRRCGNHSWFFHVAPPEAKREGKRADCGGSLFSLSIRCAHVQCSSYEGLNRLLRSQTKMAECPAGPTQIDLHSRSLCYILRCESAGQRCVGADLHFFGSLVRPHALSCWVCPIAPRPRYNTSFLRTEVTNHRVTLLGEHASYPEPSCPGLRGSAGLSGLTQCKRWLSR